MNYKIIRFFKAENRRSRVIKSGLTLEQAQAHCRDDETSSKTCKSAKRKSYTARNGEWFDGYDNH